MNNHLMLARYALQQGQSVAENRRRRISSKKNFVALRGEPIFASAVLALGLIAIGAQHAVAALL